MGTYSEVMRGEPRVYEALKEQMLHGSSPWGSDRISGCGLWPGNIRGGIADYRLQTPPDIVFLMLDTRDTLLSRFRVAYANNRSGTQA